MMSADPTTTTTDTTTGTMTAVVADAGGPEAPAHWRDWATARVDGRSIRFGLAAAPRIGFAADADYNRHHVLLRVQAFALTDRDLATLPDDGRRLAGAGRGIGSRFVGEVVATGSEVSSLRAGERVVPCAVWPPSPDVGADGVATVTASREFLRLPAGALHPVPDGMPADVAMAIAVTGQTAFAVIRRRAVAAGETVLVCAAHTIRGAVLVRALAGHGARVVALGLSPDAPSGVDGVGNVVGSLGEARRYAQQIRGFDAVVDPTGAARPAAVLPLLGISGRFVVGDDADRAVGDDADRAVGDDADRAPNVPGPGDDAATVRRSLVRKNLTVIGHHLGTRDDLTAAVRAWERGDWTPPTEPSFGPADLGAFVDHACSDRWPGHGLFHLTGIASRAQEGPDGDDR